MPKKNTKGMHFVKFERGMRMAERRMTRTHVSKRYAARHLNSNKTLCERIFGRGRSTGMIL